MIYVLLYLIVLYRIFFFAPNDKFNFLSIFIIECFYTRLMRPNKVETGRGLLK